MTGAADRPWPHQAPGKALLWSRQLWLIGLALTAVIAAWGPGVASANAIRLFLTPHAVGVPTSVAAGPDGALWFTDNGPTSGGEPTGPGGIAQVSTAGRFGRQFTFPASLQGAAGIATGPDGRMWVTGGTDLGAMTTGGVFSTFTTTAASQSITAGPDGRMWFTENQSGAPDMIGAITTSGTVTEYPVPNSVTANLMLGGIAAGRDGRLWFTETTQDSNGNSVGGRVAAITTSGTVSEFPLPANSVPGEITAGPDGALWFTQGTGDLNGCQEMAGCHPGREAVGRITTTGAITEFATYPAPYGIAAGPDARIWFTKPPNEIGAITRGGFQSKFFPPGGDSTEVSYGVGDIAAGPDGRLWFTLAGGGGAIGAISTSGHGPVPRNQGCVVPLLQGKTLAAARRALVAEHCRLGKVTEKKAKGSPGRVLSQRPKPGTKLPTSSKVTVVIGRR